MGASNNKPVRNAPSNRHRKFIPRNLWKKKNETASNDFTNNQHGMYDNQARSINFDSYDTASFSRNQHYNDEFHSEYNSDNVQTNSYVNSEGYTQFDNGGELERPFASCRSFEDVNNADQSFSDGNLIYAGSDTGHTFVNDFSGDYHSRPVTPNYNNIRMVRPQKPLVRSHSLTNNSGGLQFNEFYQNNGFQVQSYSLNNVSNGAHYDGTYQNNNRFQIQTSLGNVRDNKYYDRNVCQNSDSCNGRWGSTRKIESQMERSNSAGSVGGGGKAKKRNSLDEDFYGDDFSSGALPDNYWVPGNSNDVEVSYVGPKVKRRLTRESVEDNYSERSDSALSHRNYSPPDRTDDVDFRRDHFPEPDQSEEQPNVLDILQYPSAWSSSMNETGFVEVPSTSSEGQKLHRYFHRSSRTKDFQLYIVGITRIENPFLHTLFLLKKEEMKLRNGHVDELHLFHGTKKVNLQQICEDNLNWRMVSEKHMFGQGVSFSPLASYSSHYCDNTNVKVMLLFKVLVSNAVDGFANMKIPPIIKDVTYDTSIKENTSVIVKYSDNEFYPLYKITFTKRPI